jgi:hypothetical protein
MGNALLSSNTKEIDQQVSGKFGSSKLSIIFLKAGR